MFTFLPSGERILAGDSLIPRHPRYVIPFKVDIQLEGLQNVRHGEVVNIGTGGMFLAILYPLPKVGALIEFSIKFSAPNAPASVGPLTGSAIVRWVRENNSTSGMPVGCGVEFQYLTDESQKTLARVIDHLKTKEFIPEG